MPWATNAAQQDSSGPELQITVVIVVVILGLVAVSQIGVIVWLLWRRDRASKKTSSLEEVIQKSEKKDISHTPTVRYEDTDKNREPYTNTISTLPLPLFTSSMLPEWKRTIAKEESSFAIADLFGEIENRSSEPVAEQNPGKSEQEVDGESTSSLTQSGVICGDDLLFDDSCSTMSSMRSSHYEVYIKDQYGIDLSDSGLTLDTHSIEDTEIGSPQLPQIKSHVLMSQTEDLATVMEEPLKNYAPAESSTAIIMKSGSPSEDDRAAQLSLQYGVALGYDRPPSQRLRDSVTCYRYAADAPRTYRFSALPEELRKSMLPRQFRTRVSSLGSPNRTGSTMSALDDIYDASVNVAITQKLTHANVPRTQIKRQNRSKYGQMLSIISNYTQPESMSNTAA